MRLGDIVLTDTLVSDPIGRIHRGVILREGRFADHALVRIFSGELMSKGLPAFLEVEGRSGPLPSPASGLAKDAQVVLGEIPYATCGLVVGRTLASFIASARKSGTRIGIDHAIAMLDAVGRGLVALHAEGFQHGSLSPHSLWLGVDGSIRIIDHPFSQALARMEGVSPTLRACMAPYRSPDAKLPIQVDSYALGAIMYEALTLAAPPDHRWIGPALARLDDDISAKAPKSLRVALAQLLLVLDPVTCDVSLAECLDGILGDGDDASTFNMSVCVQSVLGPELERDHAAMMGERTLTVTASAPEPVAAPAGRSSLWFAAAGALVLGGTLGGIWLGWHTHSSLDPAVTARLAEMAMAQDRLAKLVTDAGQRNGVGLQAPPSPRSAPTAALPPRLETSGANKAPDPLTIKGKGRNNGGRPVVESPRMVVDTLPALPPAPVPVAKLPELEPVRDFPPQVTHAAAPSLGFFTKLFNAPTEPVAVRVVVTVDEAGHPLSADAKDGDDAKKAYLAAAKRAALASSFLPATHNGKPVRGEVSMVFRFQPPPPPPQRRGPQ
jgi:hypothetical protein